MITFASVDLPEPFGPMSAWVSPCITVRSIPFRMSLPSTEAVRPRISSVAASVTVLHLDQDVVVLRRHRERVDRRRGRQGPRLPRVQVEGRAVLRALDRLVVNVDLALGEVLVSVRADGVDGTEAPVAEVDHRDL